MIFIGRDHFNSIIKKRNEKNMQILYKLLNIIKRQIFSHNKPFTILFIPIAMYSPRS